MVREKGGLLYSQRSGEAGAVKQKNKASPQHGAGDCIVLLFVTAPGPEVASVILAFHLLSSSTV